jgi:hypothetical protein
MKRNTTTVRHGGPHGPKLKLTNVGTKGTITLILDTTGSPGGFFLPHGRRKIVLGPQRKLVRK